MTYCRLLAACVLILLPLALAQPEDFSGEVATCYVRVNGVTRPCIPGRFSAPVPELADASSMELVVANPPDGCSLTSQYQYRHVALIVERGNCSFVQKMNVAQAAGAKAVIVRNTLQGMYMAATNFTTGQSLQVSPCDYDCGFGSVQVQPANADPLHAYAGYACAPNTCNSQMCALTGTTEDGTSQACCVLDDLTLMGGSDMETIPPIPTVFVGVLDGRYLVQEVATGMTLAKIYARPTPNINLSSFIIWGIGCCVATFAAWNSAADLRRSMSGSKSTGGFRAALAQEVELMQPNVKQVLCFAVTAFVFLLILFFIIVVLDAGIWVVRVFCVMFAIGGTSSTSQLLWIPIAMRIAPSWRTKKAEIKWIGPVSYTALLGVSMAATVALVWFIWRNSNWSWVLQDYLGAALCCLFLATLRLTTLKSLTILLWCFLLYDVFMVFITPLIFHSSVMVTVATAGMPQTFADKNCFCRLNPDDSLCAAGEYMPIVIRFPRMFDYRGGYSMLGLGDIIMPGLLLSFLFHSDIQKRRSFWHSYSTVGLVGYWLGLALANIAVLTTGLAQPALLYLVPLTLIPVTLTAKRRGDLKELWTGKRVVSTSYEPADSELLASDALADVLPSGMDAKQDDSEQPAGQVA